MKKTTNNLMLCSMVFVVALVISNVVTAKTVQTGIPLLGSTLIFPGAVLCYAFTFLMTDVIGEIWGHEQAQTVIKWGFVCQLIATTLIVLTQFMPAVDPDMQQAYEMLLGPNVIFVFASLTAYLASQTWDVWVFHRIRGRIVERTGSTRMRWVWNNVSTMTSQLIDTAIFIGIAFGLGFGWLLDPAMHMQFFALMIGQYLVKLLLAALDTPVFYLLTHHNAISGGQDASRLSEPKGRSGKNAPVIIPRAVANADKR